MSLLALSLKLFPLAICLFTEQMNLIFLACNGQYVPHLTPGHFGQWDLHVSGLCQDPVGFAFVYAFLPDPECLVIGTARNYVFLKTDVVAPGDITDLIKMSTNFQGLSFVVFADFPMHNSSITAATNKPPWWQDKL